MKDYEDLPMNDAERRWLHERLETLTAKESLLLSALTQKTLPATGTDYINHLLSLQSCDCIAAGSYEALGEFMLEELRVSQTLWEFMDTAQLGRAYEDEHPGLFVDGIYILYPSSPPCLHYDGENLGRCVDTDWSVKLKLASESNPDGVWLRLPDYSEMIKEGAGEITIALRTLGAESIADCSALEARCILPEAGDLLTQYYSISDLFYDCQNLGFILDERNQGQKNFEQLFAAALEYEDCRTLADALDISQRLHDYELVPMDGLKDYAEKLLAKSGISLPENVEAAFNYEEYASEQLESNGFVLTRDESAYIGTKQQEQSEELSFRMA